MKKTSVLLLVVFLLGLAGFVWGQQTIEHFLLKKAQAVGYAVKDTGDQGSIQVDYFEQRDGTFFVRVMSNYQKIENDEYVYSAWANFENIPESYVQVAESHIIVDIPDVMALTGDYGCNGTYQDPSACQQPFAIKARFFKNHIDSSRNECVNMDRSRFGSFHSGGSTTLETAYLEGYVLHGEFSSIDQENRAQIYAWQEKVRNIFR